MADPSLFGLLNLHKPSGITSRRAVDQVKRLIRPVKVGHAGTLDPLASGVLVIGLGPATRLMEYVQQMPKTYRAKFLLGRTSTTEDVEGEITLLTGAREPSRGELERAAAELVGTIAQRPPAFSALKVSGRRAYALARAGESVELAARPVRVDRLEILSYEYPELELEIQCGSGTYVRSLGRDLATRAGSGAVMSALVRLAIGPFTLPAAVDPAELTRENLPGRLVPAVLAVRGLMDEHAVDEAATRRLANGLTVALPEPAADRVAAIDSTGRLAAILERRADGSHAPAKNFRVD